MYENEPLEKYVHTNIPPTGPAYHGTTNQWTQPTLRTSTAPTHITKQFTRRSPTDKNTKHTGNSGLLQIKCLTLHILDIMNIVEIILRNCCIRDDIYMRLRYCVIIQIQWTQISGRNSNGTKHSGGPPKIVEKKDRNMYGFYNYKLVFNILLVLNVEVSVF
jgi:hypothetical protein